MVFIQMQLQRRVNEKGGSYQEECTRQFSAKFEARLSQRGPNKLVEI